MINSIHLRNFRSYNNEVFEFDGGVNIIVGPNASGKTNLLEALLVICLGKSYKAKDIELVQFNKPWARLQAHTEEENRVIKLVVEGTSLQKEYDIDGQKYKRLSLNKTVPVVLFEPNHLQLLNGSPRKRRDYLDSILEQTVSGYSSLLRQYKRALSQRNNLLKKGSTHAGKQMFAWNVRLSELGGQIAEQRLRLVEALNIDIAKLYSDIAQTKTKVTITYQTACGGNYSSQMLHKLEKNTELDFLRGFTSCGPHRDDVVIELGGHLLQESASRGETRTMLLALKVLELKMLEDARDKRPILLLDDVFSELDGARRMALTEFLKGYQTFITTTDADVVVQHFMNSCNILPLAK